MGTRKTTDLSITTTNELGALSKLTTPLTSNNINVESLVCWEKGNTANFRLVTSDNGKAKDIWTKAGYTVKETPIVLWNTTNTPGKLNAATTALAESNINTICVYASTTGAGETTVAFYTSNPDRTLELLNKIS